jgi:hypothetical protein
MSLAGLAMACGLALLAMFCPLPAWAEQPIQVKANAHSFAFGQEMRFHLEVECPDPIQSIVLAYRTSDTRGTTVEAMRFSPGTAVSVDYVHDVQSRYLRPFVEVTYWWTIVSAADARLATEPQSFVYADNRFDWQTVSDGVVNVRWYRGDLQVAQNALDVAAAGLDRARQDVSVDALLQPIDVYLYANADDMRAALSADTPPGVEAQTLYETSVILVAVAPEQANIPRLRRILPHEVTHALIHEVTQSEFDSVPLWFSEGIATSVEHAFAPDPDAQSLFAQAVQERDLIPLDTLCATFPYDLGQARLAYVQSGSLIDYMRDMYGRQALRGLAAAYADGATCEGGVQRVLGVSLTGLQAQWIDNLAPRSSWAVMWEENRAWLILLVLFAVLPLLFIDLSQVRTMIWRNRRQ